MDCNLKRLIIWNSSLKINPQNGKTVDHDYYFDEKLYKSRFKIEQANAWLDGFKALLIRFEKLDVTWKNLHFFAFSLRLIKKSKVKQLLYKKAF